jgi:D-glycero-D-manno-heptose 1,7-bisphosphate phosphatase
MKNRGVFLDRDGVLNKLVYHQDIGVIDTPFTEKQFELLPEAAKGVRKINKLGLKAVLVSNQPGIAKGYYDLITFKRIEKKMFKELEKGNAFLDAVYYCLHHPQGEGKYRKNCNCRKPKPGLIKKAALELNLDLRNSFLIGDSITDIQAGQKVGVKTILLGNHKCDLCRFLYEKKVKPDYIVSHLGAAVGIIKENIGGGK